MTSKNLGQVSGVYIGTTPPENIVVIWYDSTPGVMCHKIYDTVLTQWVIIDQKVISLITYSELTNLATSVGLSVAKYYKISDKGNVLAIAITTTKVQYADSLGNILIDDLGVNIQYHVTSSNLLIDDLAGVFDVTNKKLIFTFVEFVPVITDDYILGKTVRAGVWSLAKYKISSFLSTVTGNSITWNGGFFFNFTTAISAIKDAAGGIVSKQLFDQTIANQNTAINNVGDQNQNIINNANTAISNATTDAAIYGKKIPAPSVSGEPIDVADQDTLFTSVSKLQTWINRLKVANGITMMPTFADATTPTYINSNDTVDSAFRKVQYWIKNIYSTLKLSATWTPHDYTGNVFDVAAEDTLEEAFRKVQGKFNQIGYITNGVITSDLKIGGVTPAGVLELNAGRLTLRNPLNALESCKIDAPNKSIEARNETSISRISSNGIYSNGSKETIYSSFLGIDHGVGIAGVANGNIAKDVYQGSAFLAGVAGMASNSNADPAPTFGGYFVKLKALGLYLASKQVATSYNMLATDVHLSVYASSVITISLPLNPYEGQMVYIHMMNAFDITVQGTDKFISSAANGPEFGKNIPFSTSRFKTTTFLYDGQYWLLNP